MPSSAPINTYFKADYHKDAKVMAEIQKFTGQTDAVFRPLAALDSLTMDWEIRKDTTTRIQQLFIDLGVITDFKTPVPRTNSSTALLREGRRRYQEVTARQEVAATSSAAQFGGARSRGRAPLASGRVYCWRGQLIRQRTYGQWWDSTEPFVQVSISASSRRCAGPRTMLGRRRPRRRGLPHRAPTSTRPSRATTPAAWAGSPG